MRPPAWPPPGYAAQLAGLWAALPAWRRPGVDARRVTTAGTGGGEDGAGSVRVGLSVLPARLRVVYEQPSLLGAGVVPPSLWPGWLADPDTRCRFRAKVHRRSPAACWFWTGAIGSDGHGRFRAGSRTTGTSRVVTAHLYAYQLEHGLFADRPGLGVVVRHRCDEASCQNPAHLHIGTAAENVSDYHTRRWRHDSPLGDGRGAAGRARAIRAAIRAAEPDETQVAVAAAIAAGHSSDQLVLAIALPTAQLCKSATVLSRRGLMARAAGGFGEPDPDAHLTFPQRSA